MEKKSVVFFSSGFNALREGLNEEKICCFFFQWFQVF
jgi:hypothetical protein